MSPCSFRFSQEGLTAIHRNVAETQRDATQRTEQHNHVQYLSFIHLPAVSHTVYFFGTLCSGSAGGCRTHCTDVKGTPLGRLNARKNVMISHRPGYVQLVLAFCQHLLPTCFDLSAAQSVVQPSP